jgi:hypothetical protein
LAEKELEHILAVMLWATQSRLGVCSMVAQPTSTKTPCPDTVESVTAEARRAFEALLGFCQEHDGTFWEAEKGLMPRVFALGCILVRLLLASRHL